MFVRTVCGCWFGCVVDVKKVVVVGSAVDVKTVVVLVQLWMF